MTQWSSLGESVYSGLAGVYGLQQMGTTDIDRIEVVKGAGSALYGSSAVAGAINLISKEPAFEPSVKADLQMGSWGDKVYNASASMRNDNVGLSVFAQRAEEDAVDKTGDGLTRSEVKHPDGVSDRVESRLNNFGFGLYFYHPFTRNDKLVLRGKSMSEERAGGTMTNDVYLNPYSLGTENIKTNRLSSELVYTLPLGKASELNVSAAYVHHKRNATNDTFLSSYMDTHDGQETNVEDMRPYLANSSGFQSYQYRCIEFALGNKNAAMLKPHAHRSDLLAQVQAAYESPSLYDVALQLLAREGIAVPADRLQRDWTQPYEASEGVKQAWITVYRDPHKHWDLYQLGEKLADIEDAFRLWRFRHLTTVERVIGFKRGTGGTGGVSYLKKMLDVVLFPEIWSLRTEL